MSLAPTHSISQEALPPVRVMIVDDSAVIRGFISRTLQDVASITLVSSASNGEIAVENLKRYPTDVIILDIEMPVMDGLTAIPKLKAVDPGVQILMASTLTQKNAEISVKAMSLGATDYVAKPFFTRDGLSRRFPQRTCWLKLRFSAAVARRRGVRPVAAEGAQAVARIVPTVVEKKPIVIRPMPVFKPEVLAIGSSTGGPQALFEVIRSMGSQLSQPILVTQHMPPAFTTILAEHITKQCQVTCSEAKDGDVLQAGHYYIAPGDFHMHVVRRAGVPTIHLVKDPPENFCRPAVDPMLRSLVDVYGGKILTIILTGMGQDGWKGCEGVIKAGGAVIAQDEASSIVWGMPGAVAVAGVCSAVLPLVEIGVMVRKLAART